MIRAIKQKISVKSPETQVFTLSEENFKMFTTMLHNPPRDNPQLQRLLRTKAPWQT
jgi:uncharacterized protein (DUF1778 family)